MDSVVLDVAASKSYRPKWDPFCFSALLLPFPTKEPENLASKLRFEDFTVLVDGTRESAEVSWLKSEPAFGMALAVLEACGYQGCGFPAVRE